MAEDVPNTPGPFDVPTVKALVKMMSQNNITEVDLRQGDQRIRLVRGGVIPPGTASAESVWVQGPINPGPTSSPPATAENTAPLSRPLFEVKSPTPGTFYASASPEAEPYVKVGSKVAPDTVLCLIEAMKLFTEITADVSGVIAEILVQNQQPVEFGTVLFRVDTSG